LLNRAEIDRVHTALPVRQSLRNIISKNADTANTEIGPRAEAPDRNAKVLGEVVPVLEKQPRNRNQRFVQAELLARALHLVPVDHACGEGQILKIGRNARSRHHDFFENVRNDLCIESRRYAENREKNQAGAAADTIQ